MLIEKVAVARLVVNPIDDHAKVERGVRLALAEGYDGEGIVSSSGFGQQAAFHPSIILCGTGRRIPDPCAASCNYAIQAVADGVIWMSNLRVRQVVPCLHRRDTQSSVE